MNRIKIILTSLASLTMLTGCLKNDKVAIHADFTTDKDVYELYEDIHLTNTSYAENAYVISSKWEWDGKKMWGHQPEEAISFDKTGEFEIKLTVTTDVDNVTSVKVKTVKIQDTNTAPVADFTWEPTSGIRAGDAVKFTDKSSDPDGSITAWEWCFGTTVVNDQNPEFTFVEFGDIQVSLTVTDNMKKKTTKTVTIHVDKSVYSLELLWSKAYESDKEACIKFTSPAVSADGGTVYAFSSGYHLAAFSKDGDALWTFDATKHNPSPYCTDGTKNSTACTPSVDSKGNVYIALAYNERDAKIVGTYGSGVYSVNSSGKENWYFDYGNARYIAVIPVIMEDIGQVFLTTKANPTQANYPELWETYGSQDNGQAINMADGSFAQKLLIKQGNYGGSVALKDGKLISHCNDKYGSRMFFREDGQWVFYGTNNNNQDNKALGYYDSTTLESGESSQMAVDANGRVYILYSRKTGRVSGTSVLYCYDTNKYVKDKTTAFEPEWAVAISGKVTRYYGLGVVCGEDGTVYATTSVSGEEKARVTAVSSDGTVKWESLADGNIAGSAAVDNEGFIYYTDFTLGKLVKISPEDGKKVAEIQLATDLKSSPAISSDGTIYCNGIKDGVPTLFAVKGSATGYANSWSQLGGNPSKTCVLY